jgi:hypothetical protein
MHRFKGVVSMTHHALTPSTTRQWTSGSAVARGATLLAAAAGLMLAAACGTGTTGAGSTTTPSSTSTSSTTTSTTMMPTTTSATSTPGPTSPTTAPKPTPTTTTAPLPDNPQAYAKAFVAAWAKDDRDRAEDLGSDAAVESIFSADAPSAPTFGGCEGAAGSTYCRWEGDEYTLTVRVMNEKASTGMEHAVSEADFGH